jgi:hypothetical protein
MSFRILSIPTFLIWALFVSCNPNQKKDPNVSENVISEARPSLDGTYRLEKESYQLTLEVEEKGKDRIDFRLSSYNSFNENECSGSVEGTASLRQSEHDDLESRENENGISVFVNEYVFESKDCKLTIAFDLNTAAMAWVNEWDCTIHGEACPFGDIGMLRKNAVVAEGWDDFLEVFIEAVMSWDSLSITERLHPESAVDPNDFPLIFDKNMRLAFAERRFKVWEEDPDNIAVGFVETGAGPFQYYFKRDGDGQWKLIGVVAPG